jgi:hypothetical protein
MRQSRDVIQTEPAWSSGVIGEKRFSFAVDMTEMLLSGIQKPYTIQAGEKEKDNYL